MEPGRSPKLGHFMWRACRGSLGVMKVLYDRHVIPSTQCGVCGCDEETIMHSLFRCTHAKKIWDHSSFSTVIEEAPATSFVDWLRWCAGRVSREELRTLASLCWAAWFCRNKAVYEPSLSLDAVSVAAGFARTNEEYGTYNAKVQMPPAATRFRSAMAWTPPTHPNVKVNVDAHVLEGVGVRFGVVVRDSTGRLLVAAVKKLEAQWTPEMTEAGAARYGLEVARRYGFDRVVLEGDAATVINTVHNKVSGEAPIFLIYDDIRKLSGMFSSFLCTHVRRAGNTVAHSVARWDTGNSTERICMNTFPQGIQTLAELDLIQ